MRVRGKRRDHEANGDNDRNPCRCDADEQAAVETSLAPLLWVTEASHGVHGAIVANLSSPVPGVKNRLKLKRIMRLCVG